MKLLRRVVASTAFAAACLGSMAATAQPADPVLTIDHLVPHVSTVPAVFGEPTRIFVRERVLNGLASRHGTAWNGKVVLMLHGGTYGAVPVFDFAFKDYSWMRYLAQQGFDVFAMDFNGYGGSGRPTMDDPCNTQASLQSLLIPSVIPAPCAPSYPFQLNTAVSERDELNRVIDYIRELRGVEKVSLVGYSGGGFRGGTYTSLNQEKVEKLIILASSNYNRSGSSNPPATVPARGSPMTIQSRQILEEQRWFPDVQCEGQVQPGAADAAWAASIATDPVGATWGPGVMRAPNRTLWGWNAAAAGNITVPTLVMAGQFDGLLASMNLLYADLGSSNKVLLEVACASHFYTWESQHPVVREASKQWLLHGSIVGVRNGMLWADETGKFNKTPE